MVRKSRKKKELSVWEKLQEPAPEPSKEFVSGFTALVAVALLFIFASPYFGEDNAVYRTAYRENIPVTQNTPSYVGLFTPYKAQAYSSPKVAGASIKSEIRNPKSEAKTQNSKLYNSVVSVFEVEDEVYMQGLIQPYGQAFSEVLDISEQLQPMIDFYKPGVDAAVDAWLELMADPVL